MATPADMISNDSSRGSEGQAPPPTLSVEPQRLRSESFWSTAHSEVDSVQDDDLSPEERAERLASLAARKSSHKRTLTRAVSVGNPVRFGVHSIQNLRPEMEDAHRAVIGVEGSSRPSSRGMPTPRETDMADSPSRRDSLSEPAAQAGPLLGSLSYFAVFDGHGGARAAEFSGEHLCNALARDLSALRDDPVGALREAFANTEAEWTQIAREQDLMDGTTAAVALVDRSRGRIIVGNVGDSEVVLGTRDASGKKDFKTLTEVHHVGRSEGEAERILAAGGRVRRGRLGHPLINPQVLSLSVSRALGDLLFKDPKYTDGLVSGLIAEPFITEVKVRTAQGVVAQFLVIGCDGLWDTVSYQDASNFVFAKLSAEEDPQNISEGLVKLARDAGSSDNITVMLVLL